MLRDIRTAFSLKNKSTSKKPDPTHPPIPRRPIPAVSINARPTLTNHKSTTETQATAQKLFAPTTPYDL